jgi:hypothetical protein
MSKKLIYLVSLIFVLALVTASYGDDVIGNWEDDSLDGWEICTFDPPGNTVLTPGHTTGVTLGSGSLKMVNDLGWKFAIILSLMGNDLTDEFFANNTFSIDITRLADEWTRGTGDHWSGLVLIINSDAGWDDVGVDDSWWSSEDGDVTLTASWNYSEHKAQLTNPNYLEFVIVTNTGAYTDGGIWYLDNARFSGSVFARDPDPAHEETDVPIDPILSWTAGSSAATHDVYFGTDEDAVTDANRTNPLGVLIKQDYDSNSIAIADDPNVGPLEFDTTYYWRIDEVNGTTIWPGEVWEFTTGTYIVVDDFESYSSNPKPLGDTWIAGGNADVSLSTDPVHGGAQAMAIDYNNNPAPYYSEAYADATGPNSLDFGTDWTIQSVEGLGVWFRGFPDKGSFTGTDPYTIVGGGWTIWGTADGFHYAYRHVGGPNPVWQITVRVDSVEKTDPWAKAGIMVRKTLEPDSRNIAMVLTPDNGIDFQYRMDTGGETMDNVTGGFLPPQWLRLMRIFSTKLIVAQQANTVDTPGSSDWTEIGIFDDSYGRFTAPMYMGLCVTSSNSGALCTAEFSNLTMEAPIGTDIGDPTVSNDIGIPYNDPEEMYVVLQDGDSNGIVYYGDETVTQSGDWIEWRMDLKDFIDQGVDACDVRRMYIGIGDKDVPSSGEGTVFIDDIRLYGAEFYEPECPPLPADLVRNGNVSYDDLEVLVNNWLMTPPEPNVDLYDDGTIDFKDIAEMGKVWGQKQVWPTW